MIRFSADSHEEFPLTYECLRRYSRMITKDFFLPRKIDQLTYQISQNPHKKKRRIYLKGCLLLAETASFLHPLSLSVLSPLRYGKKCIKMRATSNDDSHMHRTVKYGISKRPLSQIFSIESVRSSSLRSGGGICPGDDSANTTDRIRVTFTSGGN